MTQLSNQIIEILRRAGADKTMILGSRLGALVRAEHEDLLREEMEKQGFRFVQLVEAIDEITVVRDAGTGLDVLIGLEGAAPPTSAGRPPSLRQDVYEAFTSFDTTYSYDPEQDRFHEGVAGEGELECPEVHYSDLIEMRRKFALTLAEPVREQVLPTLDTQDGALTRFRQAVSAGGLTSHWVQFLYEALSENVRQWADTHKVPAQASWFLGRRSTAKRRSETKLLLQDLANAMTDEEARSILVPVSAVERYLSRRART